MEKENGERRERLPPLAGAVLLGYWIIEWILSALRFTTAGTVAFASFTEIDACEALIAETTRTPGLATEVVLMYEIHGHSPRLCENTYTEVPERPTLTPATNVLFEPFEAAT